LKIPTRFICELAPQLIGTLRGDKAQPAIFDNTKIKQFVPGFQAATPFRVGVRESVAWLQAHSDRQHLNPQLDSLCDQITAAWTAAALTGESPAGKS
jgi:hypothetical protein